MSAGPLELSDAAVVVPCTESFPSDTKYCAVVCTTGLTRAALITSTDWEVVIITRLDDMRFNLFSGEAPDIPDI